MKFSYPKLMFIIRAIALLAILACILFIMSMGDISNTWMLGFAGIFIMAILIAHISPIFTQHEVSNEGIRLRHGILFNDIFPYNHIETVEIYAFHTSFLGPLSKRHRIVLATGRNGLIRIKLNHKKRFGMLLLKKGDVIIIDLEKPYDFMKQVNEYMMTNKQ